MTIPKTISTAREVAYLKALAETGNASLAAAQAGVSRDWAYKKRQVDAWFDARCREMAELARERLPVQRRRRRAGGWNADRERTFLEALHATHDVEVAAGSAGTTAPSAYRHRAVRPEFAAAWAAALADGGPGEEPEWVEAAAHFLYREPLSDDNPVRLTSVGQVLRLQAKSERAARRVR